MDFWVKLFDTSGFMPRRICGIWPPGLVLLHNLSDFFIWTAYLALPVVLVAFAYRRRHELPFHQVFWLFGLFILACGTTHLMDIVLFYWPAYRLSGLIKLITAAASWGTVLALIPVVPRALAMRSPEVLQREIEERQKAEAQVRQLNAELESRVQQRTAELETANTALAEANSALEAAAQAKDELLAREGQARAEAEAANRTKDEFLAVLSHELRTPVTAIQGWAWLLHTGKLDEAAADKALETIMRNAQTQTRLIEDILDMSRTITGKMRIESRPVELTPLVRTALEAIAPAAAAKAISVEAHLAQDAGLITGDADRLQQVVWNLLSNAIKFTPRGGQVTVNVQRAGSMVEIVIADNGQGIAPGLLPHIFELFRQGDSSNTRTYGGLGLGLSIVRHLTELHGGTVRATSAGPGQGSTFTVALPIRALQGEPLPAPGAATSDVPLTGAPVQSSTLAGLRALVVDDEAEARELVAAVLNLHGAQSHTATSARQALDEVQQWQPDVLVSDIGMPGENGYHLIERVRALPHPLGELPALALTAYAAASDRERALAAGFNAHLAKPAVPDVMVAVVARLCGRLS